MSSPMSQMNTARVAPTNYSPVRDAISRHDYGVQKNRKSSTGGGRAWNEDEEIYLLQTRLQKMPYKHIASYLKKTELACRLHYHQLSHGSNRRRRTNSLNSSSPDTTAQSDVPVLGPSPIQEGANMQPSTPPHYTYSPPAAHHVSLPSASTFLPRSSSNTPPRTLTHPVAILPKPSSQRRAVSESAATSALHLDCNVMLSSTSLSSVDKDRLSRIYETHRASFWRLIAQEYGGSASPLLLEEAWKRGLAHNTPPTPCGSPDTKTYAPYAAKPEPPAAPTREVRHPSATSISSLLGIDANPTSPQERERIRMMEERRGSRDVAMTGTYAF